MKINKQNKKIKSKAGKDHFTPLSFLLLHYLFILLGGSGNCCTSYNSHIVLLSNVYCQNGAQHLGHGST